MFDKSINEFFLGKSKLEFDKDGDPTSQDVRVAVVVLMVQAFRSW